MTWKTEWRARHESAWRRNGVNLNIAWETWKKWYEKPKRFFFCYENRRPGRSPPMLIGSDNNARTICTTSVFYALVPRNDKMKFLRTGNKIEQAVEELGQPRLLLLSAFAGEEVVEEKICPGHSDAPLIYFLENFTWHSWQRLLSIHIQRFPISFHQFRLNYFKALCMNKKSHKNLDPER